MHSDKTSLKEAESGITSQKPNHHRGLWRLVRVKHVVSMRQVNPKKASRRKANKCFHIIKTMHDFFKGSLSNLSHLRQVMLQQKSQSILSK
jgi:hypothetical protein